MLDVLLTPAEVAESVKLSVEVVRRSVRRGELRAVKLAGQLRFREEDVRAWIDAGEVRPAQRAAPVALEPLPPAPAASTLGDLMERHRPAA